MKPKVTAGCKTASACILGLVLTTFGVARAQSPAFTRACQKWIDQKGYSTDYIEHKSGKRQPGLASEWKGNVAVESVRPGDVVLIKLPRDAMHAACVEEVRSANGSATVRISESNRGRMTDRRCLVTENFGKTRERLIPRDSIAYVWRPGLPLSP
jgi:hypothetical protein